MLRGNLEKLSDNEERSFSIVYDHDEKMVLFEYSKSLFLENNKLNSNLTVSLMYNPLCVPEMGDVYLEIICSKPDFIPDKYEIHANYESEMEIENMGGKPILPVIQGALNSLDSIVDEVIIEIGKFDNPVIFNLREAINFFKDDYEQLTDYMVFGENEHLYPDFKLL